MVSIAKSQEGEGFAKRIEVADLDMARLTCPEAPETEKVGGWWGT